MAREGSEISGSDTLYPPMADGSPSRALAPVPTYAAPAPMMAGFGFGGGGPEIIYGGFNQTWLANCLRRRWLMAILMGLLIGAGATGLLLFLFPSVAQVTAYLKVKSPGSEVFQDQSRKLSPQDVQRQAMNHLALLKSPLVLQAALSKTDIADLDAVRNQKGDALLWLTEELKISFPGDGEILEVRYEGKEDAKQMEKVMNAVVSAYREKVLQQEKLLAAATQDDLKVVLDSQRATLQKRLKELVEKQTANMTLRQDVEIPQLTREITLLETRVNDIKKEMLNIEVFKQLSLMTAQSPAAMQSAVAEILEKDPMMDMFKQQLFALNQQLETQQASARNPNSPQIRRLKAQIEQTNQNAAQYQAKSQREAEEAYQNMPKDQLRAALAEYNIRYQALSTSLTETEADLQEKNDRLAALGVTDPDVEMLEQNIENESEIVRGLEQQIMQWQVIQQAGAGKDQSELDKVTIIQPATGLANINTVERFSIAGVGGMAATALTCYGIALLEFRRRRLNSPTDVDEGLGIRVLGVLPPATLKTLAGSSLVASQVAEAIDNVRATLMHDSTSNSRQVVMVTSSGSQEGATVVASSLALSLSRAGRRTLLVDADLRAPALHKLFGMPVEDGLSEVLRSEIDLADAVRPTNNEGLYLLTAGVCSAEAIQALATDQPQAVFEKLRDQFDFIVIDTPPVLGISDTLSLGQYVDGAILTVLRDHSEIRKVYKAVDLLRSMGVRVIGSVVNGVPLKADHRVVRLHQASAQRVPRLPAKVDG